MNLDVHGNRLPRGPNGPRTALNLARFKYPPQSHYTVHQAFCDYSRERLINKGKSPMHAWCGFNNFLLVVPPEQNAETIGAGQIEDFVDARVAAGRSVTTARRELVFVKAALRNAHRRNRIKLLPYIEVPDGHGAERRPLTEDEYRPVLRQPMSGRLYRFYRVAYFTGHRARAIEELTWSRVDFDRLTMNFNVPGRAINNKRRNGAFPIPDEFLETLRGWQRLAKDGFVIGAGASTYHEAAHVVRDLAGITDPAVVPRHCMRKMFATEMFKKRADPEVVGVLMADDPNTLRKHYVKFTDDVMRSAANLRAATLP
jgi:integrase